MNRKGNMKAKKKETKQRNNESRLKKKNKMKPYQNGKRKKKRERILTSVKWIM